MARAKNRDAVVPLVEVMHSYAASKKAVDDATMMLYTAANSCLHNLPAGPVADVVRTILGPRVDAYRLAMYGND